MTAIALRPRTRIADSSVHTSGEVLSVDARRLRVQTALGPIDALCAASCLLQPEPGDKVLVSGASVEECYVIAVLERAGSTPQNLQFSGDTLLSVQGGSLKLSSDERVDINAGTAVSVSANEMQMRASKAKLLFGELSAIGRAWNGTLGQLQLVGEALDSIFQRVTQHAKTSLRTVEETDQVRSGDIDYRAESNLHVQGKNTLVTARELVKINGSQVHVG